MATVDQKTKTAPPYVAFGTFKSFLAALKKSGIPSQIDKSVMKGMSGGVQSHLATALRFLDLVDGESPRPSLLPLVNAANSPEWAMSLKETVAGAYAPIIAEIDLATATPQQLTDAFRNKTTATGATLDKAIRFYLQAAKESEIVFGPHLSGMKVTTTYKKSGKGTKPSNANGSGRVEEDEDDDLLPKMIRFPIPLVNKQQGFIEVPADITPNDCAIVKIMVSAVEAYAAQNEQAG